MLCDICKKNPATIHIKGVIGDDQKTLNLCSSCAAEHEKTSGINFGAFNLAEMLYNLEKLAAPHQEPVKEEGPVCEHCGWTRENLCKSGGRLGCPECYRTFAAMVQPALEHVHRGTAHTGKVPGSTSADPRALLRAELARLRQEMNDLVKVENYEKAAEVRDRIREIQKQLDSAADAQAKGGCR